MIQIESAFATLRCRLQRNLVWKEPRDHDCSATPELVRLVHRMPRCDRNENVQTLLPARFHDARELEKLEKLPQSKRDFDRDLPCRLFARIEIEHDPVRQHERQDAARKTMERDRRLVRHPY